jgi:hypothetical protein
MVVVKFTELMRLAAALGRARKSGDVEAIAKAKAEHDFYMNICRTADVMDLSVQKAVL